MKYRVSFRVLALVVIGIGMIGAQLLVADENGESKTKPISDNRAVLVIQLPDDATLEVQGVEIQLSGSIRRVRTSPLEPGKLYSYVVRATWNDRDGVKHSDRKVELRSGQQVNIRFEDAAGTQDLTAQKPRMGVEEPTVCALGRFLLKLQHLEPVLGSFERLIVSSDLRYALTHKGGLGASCRLWDVTGCREIRRFTDAKYMEFIPTFSPDGRRLAYLIGYETVMIHDLRTGNDIAKLTASDGCTCVAFSADGQSLALGQEGGEICLQDIESGKVLFRAQKGGERFDTFNDVVNSIKFCPDGKSLLSAYASRQNKDSPVILWDASTGKLLRKFSGKLSVHDVAISPDSQRAICRCENGNVILLDLQSGEQLPGDQLKDARSALDTLQKVLPKSTGQPHCDLGRFYVELKRIEWLIGPFTRPFVSPSGRFVMTDSGRLPPPNSGKLERPDEDGLTRLWDVKERRESVRLKRLKTSDNQDFDTSSVIFSPDGHKLAYQDEEQITRVYDAQAGVEICRIKLGKDIGRMVHSALSPDGQQLLGAVTTWDGKEFQYWIGLWDLNSAKEIRRQVGFYPSTISYLNYMPDGRRFVASGSDKAIRIYDTDTGKEVSVLKGHVGDVHGFLVSPDGRRVLSGSSDGTVRLWNVETGKELHEKEWLTPWMREVLQSASGQPILTTGVRQTPGPHNTPQDTSSGGGGGARTIIIFK